MGARSVVTRARSASPLHLLTPRNHGHAAWVFQSSHGGGMVGRDDVSLSVQVAEGATLYLGSQGAGRIYARARARFSLHAQVGPGASLLAWPDPLSCFSGADFTQHQTFELAAGASLLLVDAWSAGRVARDERWDAACIASRILVRREGQVLFHDAVALEPLHGAVADRMGTSEALATVVLVGPALQAAAKVLASQVHALPLGEAPLLVASPWPWGLVLRASASRVELLVQTLRRLLQPHLALLLGEDPLSRKW